MTHTSKSPGCLIIAFLWAMRQFINVFFKQITTSHFSSSIKHSNIIYLPMLLNVKLKVALPEQLLRLYLQPSDWVSYQPIGSSLVFWFCLQSMHTSRIGEWARPYGDFLMTHFLALCCCKVFSPRSRSAAFPNRRKCSARWFLHTCCCQDMKRHRVANSYAATLQDHRLTRTHERQDIVFTWSTHTHTKGIRTDLVWEIRHVYQLGVTSPTRVY